ncbi:hypothetical protein M436DRAFT_81899 [Aureobasidium namibiae CBS 147.97]|uniref:Uncharacterized protein n=1 Tax=Aureobasidium namibiae CBS 147.97 TaxID=1043004 RepID=A0A074WKB7_9PEZI
MSCKENTPINNTTKETTIPVIDTSHGDRSSADRVGNTLANLMGPLTSWLTNASSPRPVSAKGRHSTEVTPRRDEETASNPQNHKLDPETSNQDDQPIQSDEELSEVSSAYVASDEGDDDYEFTYEDDDDDLPIDSDPFFGDTPTKLRRPRQSDQPTEEQLEAIRKVLEEDKAKEASKMASIRKNNPPDLIVVPHPLLKDQNDNATEMLMSIRSSFGGDVFHIIGLNEPLLEMKLKFLQDFDLPLEELHELEFLCGYYVIQDDDTVQKLEIGTESIIYCQKIEAMRYDLSPEPAAIPELVPCVYGEEADALNSASVHEEEAMRQTPQTGEGVDAATSTGMHGSRLALI